MKTQNKTGDTETAQVLSRRSFGFFMVQNEVVRNFGPVIGHYGLAVYSVLASMVDNETQECFPKQSTIADLACMGRTKVNETLKVLKTHGLIEIKENFNQMGFRVHSTYTLLDVHSKKPVTTESLTDLNTSSQLDSKQETMNSGCSPDEQHELNSLELDSDSESLSSYEDNVAVRSFETHTTEAVKEEIQPPKLYIVQPVYSGTGTVEDPAIFKGEALVLMPKRQEIAADELDVLSPKARFQTQREHCRQRASELLKLLDRCENTRPRKLKLVGKLPESHDEKKPFQVTNAGILYSYIKELFGEVEKDRAFENLGNMLKQLRHNPWPLYDAIGDAAKYEIQGDIINYLWGIVRAKMKKAGLSSLPNRPAGKTETAEIKKLKEKYEPILAKNKLNYVKYLDYQQRWLEQLRRDYGTTFADQPDSIETQESIRDLEKLVAFYGNRSEAA